MGSRCVREDNGSVCAPTGARRRLPVLAQESARSARLRTSGSLEAAVCDVEPVQAAETILRRFGARAITVLTSPRVLDDGRCLPARLSANDCYVALEEACRKMARVALRKFEADPDLQEIGFA